MDLIITEVIIENDRINIKETIDKSLFVNDEVNKIQEESVDHGKFNCQHCCKSFKKKYDWETHMRTHTGEKPFQCIICDRCFNQRSNVLRHMKTHRVWPYKILTLPDEVPKNVIENSAQNIFSCLFCSNNYKTYSELKSHLRFHADLKMFLCIQEECTAMFNDMDEFVNHVIEHDGSKGYKCNVCPAICSTQETLEMHKKTHSDKTEKKFYCETCKRSFATNSAYKIHITVDRHSYTCKQCSKNYKSEKQLRVHLLQCHNSNKSISTCKVCSKEFASFYLLKRHSLLHGERSYKCQTCQASFIRKDGLSRHLLTHQNSFKFKCPFDSYGCTSEFSRKDKLKNHIEAHKRHIEKQTKNQASA